MRTRIAASIFVTLGLASTAALAERPHGTYIPVTARPQSEKSIAASGHWVLYMDRKGGSIYPGNFDDSRTSTSSIINNTINMPAYSYGDASWAQVMSCVKSEFSRFNITVTDVDPGQTPHITCVTSGSPSDAGMDPSTGGVSPWTGGTIDNSIVFDFASVWGGNVRDICETAAQEVSHSFGLDHEYLCADPMTYLTGCGNKTFQDTAAPCGEYSARACRGVTAPASTQNSVKELIAALGTSTSAPPTVDIASPTEGQTVQMDFGVTADAMDDIQVVKVEFYVDSKLVGTKVAMPWFYKTSGLSDGAHTIEARAYDDNGQTASAMVHVMQKPACSQDTDCQAGAEVCVSGKCVAAPGMPGGIGTPCTSGSMCSTGVCAMSGTDQLCTASCDLTHDQCPGGYSCQGAGANAVCWPDDPSNPAGNGSSASGGCTVGGGSAPSSSLGSLAGLGLALLGLALSVRSRRRS